jgi:serine/threonine protein phosphatase PrpC
MPIAFHYAARSDVGLVRTNNQDSGYAGPHLLVVADGMGGHAGGDVASSTAIGALAQLDDESVVGGELSGQIIRGLHRANSALTEMSAARPELLGMGTTVTALLRGRNKIVLAHIGDSRAYLLRDGTFEQITHDHSFVQTLVDQGRITEAEAEYHPQRSLVTRVLTGQRDDEPDLALREALPGDRFLVCSDGLSGFVARDTIHDVLAGAATPGQAADRLVELSLKAGAPDNVTVIVADVVDIRTGQMPPSEPQVVGAAAANRSRTRPIPVTPAAKAAALRDELAGPSGPEVEDFTLAEEGSSSAARRVLRRVAGTLLVVLVAGGALYAVWVWSQSQYYVGASGGKVAIFQGVSQSLGPVTLSHADWVSTVDVEDLPDFYRSRVEGNVTVDSRADAQRVVESLAQQALLCIQKKAADEPCGSGAPGESSTGTASTSTASTGTASTTTGRTP